MNSNCRRKRMSIPNRKLRALAEAYGHQNEMMIRRQRAVARAAVIAPSDINSLLAEWRARIGAIHAPMESRDSMAP